MKKYSAMLLIAYCAQALVFPTNLQSLKDQAEKENKSLVLLIGRSSADRKNIEDHEWGQQRIIVYWSIDTEDDGVTPKLDRDAPSVFADFNSTEDLKMEAERMGGLFNEIWMDAYTSYFALWGHEQLIQIRKLLNETLCAATGKPSTLNYGVWAHFMVQQDKEKGVMLAGRPIEETLFQVAAKEFKREFQDKGLMVNGSLSLVLRNIYEFNYIIPALKNKMVQTLIIPDQEKFLKPYFRSVTSEWKEYPFPINFPSASPCYFIKAML